MKAPRAHDVRQLCRALADETRLRILALLASGEVCVCNIHDAIGVPQPTASRHLAYLRRAGLVTTRRDGLWIHYRIAMPEDRALAALVRAALTALDSGSGGDGDRKRLSRLTGVPLRVLAQEAECCVRKTD